MDSNRGRGQRAGLSHSFVLAAARDLLAEGGSDAVTMRALARRLEVAPNALYSHVQSKTALLDDLLDDVLSGVDAPAPDPADPVTGLKALMSSTYDLLNRHPDLVPLYLARQGARGPHAVRLGQSMDALLAAAGVATASVPLARRVLIVHTIGFAAFATAGPGAGAAEPQRPISSEQSRESFRLSLDWLLVGIVHGARSA
jgi:AcrR family transcriptional regulator